MSFGSVGSTLWIHPFARWWWLLPAAKSPKLFISRYNSNTYKVIICQALFYPLYHFLILHGHIVRKIFYFNGNTEESKFTDRKGGCNWVEKVNSLLSSCFLTLSLSYHHRYFINLICSKLIYSSIGRTPRYQTGMNPLIWGPLIFPQVYLRSVCLLWLQERNKETQYNVRCVSSRHVYHVPSAAFLLPPQ